MKTLEEQIAEAVATTPLDYIKKERAACVKLVRDAGCICYTLIVASGFQGKLSPDKCSIVDHDYRCPQALALKLEASNG